MLFWPSLAICVLFFLGAVVLAWMSAIDLKLRLLPDELTIALATLGVLFRFAASPYAGPWFDAALGALAGGGALLLVRGVANRIYGFETMGLGDIKLMAACGMWLGLEGAITALCAGAVIGMLHGVAVLGYQRIFRDKTRSFRDMTIPAGPGFCAGAALTCLWRFYGLPLFGAG